MLVSSTKGVSLNWSVESMPQRVDMTIKWAPYADRIHLQCYIKHLMLQSWIYVVNQSLTFVCSIHFPHELSFSCKYLANHFTLHWLKLGAVFEKFWLWRGMSGNIDLVRKYKQSNGKQSILHLQNVLPERENTKIKQDHLFTSEHVG